MGNGITGEGGSRWGGRGEVNTEEVGTRNKKLQNWLIKKNPQES